MIQGAFLPSTLSEWTGLIIQGAGAVIVALGATTAFVRRPLMDAAQRDRDHNTEHFERQGARIGDLEKASGSNTAKIESVDRQNERLHLQMTSLAEHHGRLEERLGSLAMVLDKYHDQRVAEDRLMGERLARIEAKMDLPHITGK